MKTSHNLFPVIYFFSCCCFNPLSILEQIYWLISNLQISQIFSRALRLLQLALPSRFLVQWIRTPCSVSCRHLPNPSRSSRAEPMWKLPGGKLLPRSSGYRKGQCGGNPLQGLLPMSRGYDCYGYCSTRRSLFFFGLWPGKEDFIRISFVLASMH